MAATLELSRDALAKMTADCQKAADELAARTSKAISRAEAKATLASEFESEVDNFLTQAQEALNKVAPLPAKEDDDRVRSGKLHRRTAVLIALEDMSGALSKDVVDPVVRSVVNASRTPVPAEERDAVAKKVEVCTLMRQVLTAQGIDVSDVPMPPKVRRAPATAKKS